MVGYANESLNLGMVVIRISILTFYRSYLISFHNLPARKLKKLILLTIEFLINYLRYVPCYRFYLSINNAKIDTISITEHLHKQYIDRHLT